MPDWGPIGETVFNRTYARTKEDGTKETFDEVVDRMVEGNCNLVEGVDEDERSRLKELISQFKLLPAGRHWWVSGIPGRQFLFNCHRAGWTSHLADHVGFMFNELMKGGGVGSNYSQEYRERLHRIRRNVYVTCFIPGDHPDAEETMGIERTGMPADKERYVHYIVPDTREGWVDAMRFLSDQSQLEGPDICIVYDLSEIRPRGSSIRGFGGVASGPGPLFEALAASSEVLRRAVGRHPSAIELMEIDHHIARCVIAGNVRRSARMSILHWSDPEIFEFINLKRSGGHWTTNISVELDKDFWSLLRGDDKTANEILKAVSEGMVTNGEPGIFNSHMAAKGEERDVRCTNPCGEIALEEWENCNLGHVNLAAIKNDEELDECLELMARWLVRATFSDGMVWFQKQVVQRNRRIGVGILGFQEWLWNRFKFKYDVHLTVAPLRDRLTAMYRHVYTTASLYSADLGIPTPIKFTTVAPTGTVAKLAGVTEGIHPIFSRYFIRRVRYASTDPEVSRLIEAGYDVESDVVNPNTVVVSFPSRDSALDVIPDKYALQANELSVMDMLRVQRVVQEYWADNAVSFTVNVREGTTAQVVRQALMTHGQYLKGTTIVPEGSFAQMPLERISEEAYESLAAIGPVEEGSSADECVNGCPVR